MCGGHGGGRCGHHAGWAHSNKELLRALVLDGQRVGREQSALTHGSTVFDQPLRSRGSEYHSVSRVLQPKLVAELNPSQCLVARAVLVQIRHIAEVRVAQLVRLAKVPCALRVRGHQVQHARGANDSEWLSSFLWTLPSESMVERRPKMCFATCETARTTRVSNEAGWSTNASGV